MKKKYIVLIVVAILVAAFAIAGAMAVKSASRLLEEKRKNLLGLDLEIKSYNIDWMRARIVLEGVALYPTGQVEEKEKLASVEKMILAFSPRDMHNIRGQAAIIKYLFKSPAFVCLL